MSLLLRLFRFVVGVAIVAGLTHLAVMQALPGLVMAKILAGFTSDPSASEAARRVTRPPVTDASARMVVMPSPDLLYAACRFDVSQKPVRIKGAIGYDRYWSVALYGARTDMFFVTNDTQQQGKPVDLLLVSASGNASPATVPEGARVIIAPTDTGLMLTRLLVGNDEASRAKALAAREQIDCQVYSD